MTDTETRSQSQRTESFESRQEERENSTNHPCGGKCRCSTEQDRTCRKCSGSTCPCARKKEEAESTKETEESGTRLQDVRVPISIVQAIQDPHPKSLLRKSRHFEIVVLFGLLAHVDPKKPHKQVSLKISKILKEASTAGQKSATRRFSGEEYRNATKALVGLRNREVTIKKIEWRKGRIHKRTTRNGTVLSLLSWDYVDKSDTASALDAVRRREKVNISQGAAAVYKLKDGPRPVGISFTLNSDLADELKQRDGKTTFLGEVFQVLKLLSNDPAACRLALWVISCRDIETKTNADWLWENILSGENRRSAKERRECITRALRKVQEVGVVECVKTRNYAKSTCKTGEYLVIRKNLKWHLTRSRNKGVAR